MKFNTPASHAAILSPYFILRPQRRDGATGAFRSGYFAAAFANASSTTVL